MIWQFEVYPPSFPFLSRLSGRTRVLTDSQLICCCVVINLKFGNHFLVEYYPHCDGGFSCLKTCRNVIYLPVRATQNEPPAATC